jgi:hypothetical protein
MNSGKKFEMNDTLPETQRILDELYKKFSGEEKILIASGMFDVARQIVLSSLPNKLSKKEKLKALILRFYKDDFTEKQIEDIFKKIEKLDDNQINKELE